MEISEELEQNCDGSGKSGGNNLLTAENSESDNQSQEDEEDEEDQPGNESDKEETTGENSNDLVEESEDAASASEKQNEGEWYDFSEDEEDDSEEEEVNESVIDQLLEQGLPESKRLEKTAHQQQVPAVQESVPSEQQPISNNNKEPVKRCPVRAAGSNNNEPTIKRITILDEKDENAFEVLPGDWIKVRHSSGLPLYLHRPTRVCTLAKPYYLGPASVRRHSVPLSAIPCLAYRRGVQKELRDKELLEKAKELENDKPLLSDAVEGSSTEENPLESNNTSSKDSGDINNKKQNSLAAELGEEKVNLLKRKIMEKELHGKAKRGKQEGQGNSQQCAVAAEGESVCNKSALVLEDNGNSSLVTTNTTLESTQAPVSYPSQLDAQKRKNLKKTEIPAINKRMQALNNKRGNESIPGLKTLLPLAKVETAKENASLYSVPPLELRDYCKKLFRFSVVECKRFKTWSARRMHSKEQKRRQLERPTLPDNAQVIKFFDISDGNGGDDQMTKKFNDYIFNPNGKSSVCILHEFVQHALRKQPTYTFQELENAATPYAATVMISNTPYGKGLGSSKRTAKAAAAKATLEILIPKMKDLLNGNKQEPGGDFDITEYFQQVGMNDVRIAKLCASISEPSPYTLLLTCLQRSFGQSGSTGVKFDMIPPDPAKGNPPNQFRMSTGKDEVVVTASNKREGKQLASQLLLAKIHPHIKNFGAFIKMYGNGSIKSVKEKKQEEQQITTLQSKASANSPNWAILEKLRQEMLKLARHEAREKDRELGMDTSSSSDIIQPSPATSIKADGQDNLADMESTTEMSSEGL